MRFINLRLSEEMCELSTVLRPKLLPYEVVIPEQLPVSFFVPLVGPTVDIVLSLEHPISSAVASVFFSYDCPLVTEDDLDGANSVLLTPSLPRYISLCSDCEGELTGLTENPEHARGVFVYARRALDQPCGRLQLDRTLRLRKTLQCCARSLAFLGAASFLSVRADIEI